MRVRAADPKSSSVASSEWRPIGEVFLSVMSSVESKRGEAGLPRPLHKTPH
jgi:hypothetical protein